MQVKNEIILSAKYPGTLLQNEHPIWLTDHGTIAFFESGSDVIAFLKGYFFRLPGIYSITNSGELQRSRMFLASVINKEHPGQPLTAPDAREENEYFGNKFNFLHEFLHSIKTKAELLKIKRKINQLQRLIDAPRMLRPSYGALEYDVNSYYIEIDKKGVMRLIETEKNRVREVRRTKELDELLYWIFTNITFSMAFTIKSGNNADGYDHRRQIFLKQEELLGKLNPRWKEKKHAEYKAFLRKYPVDNIPGEGPAYFEALRKLIRLETVENQPNYFRFS